MRREVGKTNKVELVPSSSTTPTPHPHDVEYLSTWSFSSCCYSSPPTTASQLQLSPPYRSLAELQPRPRPHTNTNTYTHTHKLTNPRTSTLPLSLNHTTTQPRKVTFLDFRF